MLDDHVREPTESFAVDVDRVEQGRIADGHGVVTVTDDDWSPARAALPATGTVRPVAKASTRRLAMLEPITGLPEGVIGFVGRGEMHADDYTKVLLPAVDAELAAGRDLRVLLVFEQWDGMSGGALWEDLKMGTHHLTRWKRIALVTDVEWMVHLTHLFGWMTPGDLKVFPLAERDAAIEWAAAGAAPA